MPAPPIPAPLTPAPANPATANAAAPSDSEFAFAGLPSGGAAANASAPYMIGDFFAGSGQIVLTTKNSTGSTSRVVGQIPNAGGSGLVKVSEDNSVFPIDRVFFNYNYFDNAILAPNGRVIDVNRYTPGFEKTFWDRQASLEVRIPFASTESPDINLQGKPNDMATVFGNMEATLKFLLWKNDDWAAAAGVAFNLPTARDTRIFTAGGPATFTIENESTRVQPYFGVVFTPSKQWFIQTFVEFDVPCTANRVEQFGRGTIGSLRDQALLLFGHRNRILDLSQSASALDHRPGAGHRIPLHHLDPRRQFR